MIRSLPRYTILLLLLISFWSTAFSQTLQTAPPSSVQVSEERLKKIDLLIQQYIDSGWINGATALIARNGKIVYYKGLGYDDISSKKPLHKDAIMRIASQTRPLPALR